MLTETEAAYVAGFLDGEGHVGIACQSSGRFVPFIRTSNTNQQVILWIAQRLPGNKIWEDQRENGHKTQWHIEWTSRQNMLMVLDAVQPFLIVKAEAAFYLREFLTTMRPQGGSGKNHRISTDEQALRQELYIGCREVNKRGVRCQ